MSAQRLTVFTPPSPEAIAAVTTCLGQAGVNGVSMLINRMQEGDAIRLMVDQPSKALTALEQAGFMVKSTPVFAIELPDRPGAIAEFLHRLGEHKVDYDFMNVFPSGIDPERAIVVLLPKQEERLIQALQGSDYRQLEAEELT